MFFLEITINLEKYRNTRSIQSENINMPKIKTLYLEVTCDEKQKNFFDTPLKSLVITAL